MRGPTSLTLKLNADDVSRLRSLRALLGGHLDAVTLVKITVDARRLDLGVMDEEVLIAILWGDEAVPLIAVELLHGSIHAFCHGYRFSFTRLLL